MDQMFTNPMQNMMGMRNRGAERGSDLVARETAVAQATTQLKQAQAQIKEINAILRDTKSVAPFNGVIEKVHVEEGDTVQPGQPMITYSEQAGYQVRADVPQRLRAGLVEGMPIAVKLDGEGPSILTRISRIFPTADPTQHTVRVELDLPPGSGATAGQYAEVSVPDLSYSQSSDIVIPKTSVIRKGGLPLVFGVGSDGRARLRVVRLGEDVGSKMCVVLSGVREGDLLVDNPPPGLRSGTLVAPSGEPQISTSE
jgi:RND family efflux transporter MFP subunit